MALDQPSFDALLARITANDPTLQIANFTQQQLTTADFAALATALSNNTTITRLDLSKNKIHDADALLLANALRGKSLDTIDFNFCHIEDAGIIALAPVLANMQSIKELNLADGRFTVKGFDVLMQACLGLQNLESLNLAYNRLGLKMAEGCCQLLQNTQSLKNLDISGCYLMRAGMMLISKNLVHCVTLERLIIWGNGIVNCFDPDLYDLETMHTGPVWTPPPPRASIVAQIKRSSMMCFGYNQIKPQTQELVVAPQADAVAEPRPRLYIWTS